MTLRKLHTVESGNGEGRLAGGSALVLGHELGQGLSGVVWGSRSADQLEAEWGWCMFSFAALTGLRMVNANQGERNMERRWTTRRKLGLDVDVVFDGGGVQNCYTHDIGLGGVFVKTGERALPGDLPVELHFKLRGPTEIEEHTIRAKVVRLVPGGAGLMFRDFDAGAFRSLQRVLKVREVADTVVL